MTSILPTRCLTLLLAALIPLVSWPQEPQDELKAAVVLSFLRYGEWHQSLGENAPLAVCVLGRADFATALQNTLDGKTVAGRSLQVIELRSISETSSCQIVYFATDRVPEIKAALHSSALGHMLTIGETRDFLDWGGAVNLFVLDGHMTFEVSLEALQRTGVTISSRLLRFGQIRMRKKA